MTQLSFLYGTLVWRMPFTVGLECADWGLHPPTCGNTGVAPVHLAVVLVGKKKTIAKGLKENSKVSC